MRILHWITRQYKAYRHKTTASYTVKYMFPALLGSVLLLSANSITSIDQSYVYLSSDIRTVEVGELVSVEVGVSAHTPINAVDITIDYPADMVEVFSIDRGQSVLTLWTEDPVVTTDSVRFAGGTFRRGFVGDHEIATVKFRAQKTGQYRITTGAVTFVAGDGSGDEVAADTNPANSTSLFNFDENTSEEQIRVAIAQGVTTDLNQDGRVTLQDISAFMGAWNTQTQVYDFDRDGRMTFRDFSIILADFFLR